MPASTYNFYPTGKVLPEVTVYGNKFIGDLKNSKINSAQDPYNFSSEGCGWADNVNIGFDMIGIIDPTGIADFLNAAFYAGRGQWGNAGISLLGIIPFLGDIGKAGRLGGKTLEALPKGFKQVKKFGFPHGQKVYKFKGKYFSKDIDRHNGGVWKVFEEVNGKLKRIGTADENLKIFKD
mgnify:CR=1 FL=1